MGQAVGEVLPSALGVALSPVPIIAVILMLGTPRARSNGPAFAVGWVLGLVTVSVLVMALASGSDDPDSGTSTAVHVLMLVLGLLFLVMAVKQWHRPRAGAPAAMPRWMTGVDHLAPRRSLGLGVLLSGANPKNLALTLAAAASVAQAGLDGVQSAEVIAVFVIIGSLTVVGPVLCFLVAGESAATPLATLRGFTTHNSAVIMMVILVLLGAKLVGDGIAGLSA